MKTSNLLLFGSLPLAVILALASAVASAAASDDWQLVWADEFNGVGLPNPQWWDYETGYIRNNELQYYTDARFENCRQENGNLVIQARWDNFQGNSITSASLTSQRSASWTYGKFEVRAQMPGGRGTWPAIWMLGDNIGEVGWPHCGEIDIMEFVGYDPDTIHGTVHTTSYNHIQNTARGDTIDFDDLAEAMHVYAVEWEPEEIRFYVDDQLYFTFANDGNGSDATWPFHRPQHLKLNLAIGGDWGGAQGVDNNIYPTQFLIDYVRVYQRPQNGPYPVSLQSTGPGSLRIDPQKDSYQAGETVTLVADPDIGMRLGKWKNVQLDRALKTTLTVNRPLLIEADFIDPGSLLQNTSFADGLNGWYHFIDPSATASITTNESEQANISVTQAGSADWHVQFGQGGFALENGKRYQLSFDAQAESGTPILTAALSQNAAPYATYQSSAYTLTHAEKRYTLSFTHIQASNANARVEFRAGTTTGSIALDNVRLLNLDDDPLTPYETWKRDRGIRPIADAEDPDHDLRPNLLEYIWESDPFEKDPYMPIATVSTDSEQTMPIPNFGTNDLDNEIIVKQQHSQDLENWEDVTEALGPFRRISIRATPPIAD